MEAPPDRVVEPRSPIALIVGATAFFLLTAFSPAAAGPYFTPKLALLLILGAVGLPFLVRLVLARDPAGLGAALFAAWACFAAFRAHTAIAWYGKYLLGTGALFVVALACAYAIGRHLDDRACRGLSTGVLVAGTVNALIACLQGPFDLKRFSIYLIDDRSSGLMGNPVFLGAACGAAFILVVPRLSFVRWPLFAMPTLFSAAIQLSGTRYALAMILVGLVWAFPSRGRRIGLALLASVALGLGLGFALRSTGNDTAAVARVVDPGGGLAARVENWRSTSAYVPGHALTGTGPGLWAVAANPRRTVELAHLNSPERRYEDAHNILVEYGVTTGVVGLLLLLAWVGAGSWELLRGCRLEFALAAGALLFFHLLEPQNLGVTPLMTLCFAAAAGKPLATPAGRARTATLVAAGVLAVGAAVVGGRLLLGDVLLHRAFLDYVASDAEATARWLPWAAPYQIAARITTFDALAGKGENRTGLLAAARLYGLGRQREPDSPDLALEQAAVLARAGEDRDAADAYADALRENPTSIQALALRARILNRLGDHAKAVACDARAAFIRGREEGRPEPPLALCL